MHPVITGTRISGHVLPNAMACACPSFQPPPHFPFFVTPHKLPISNPYYQSDLDAGLRPPICTRTSSSLPHRPDKPPFSSLCLLSLDPQNPFYPDSFIDELFATLSSIFFRIDHDRSQAHSTQLYSTSTILVSDL